MLYLPTIDERGKNEFAALIKRWHRTKSKALEEKLVPLPHCKPQSHMGRLGLEHEPQRSQADV
jgi:hypothetical protein